MFGVSVSTHAPVSRGSQPPSLPDMVISCASSPWPAPAVRPQGGPWHFAQRSGEAAAWHFELRRNVSLTPRQMLRAYALLCGVALAVAAGFWWHGVGLVLLFTGLELLAVGIALLLAARHAGDREIITLDPSRLHVEQRVGPGVERTDFRTAWVRVEPSAGDGSLVELSGEGLRVRIGRHLRPELRVTLAHELRQALHQVRGTPQPMQPPPAADDPSRQRG